MYKILGQAHPAATVETTLYTTPTDKNTVVASIIAANVGSLTDYIRVHVIPASGSAAVDNAVYYDLPVPANDSFVATIGITINDSESIVVRSTNGDIAFTLSGNEDSISGGTGLSTTTYSRTFTTSNLAGNKLTVVHNLGAYYVDTVVYDNNGDVFIPDNVHQVDENTTEIDFDTVAPILGTWAVRCFTAGAGGGGGGGASAFTDLTDAPHTYVGQANKYVRVNSVETGVEFVNPLTFNGQIVQVAHTQFGDLFSTDTIIPHDDSIPQNTEGAEVTQLATTITPTDPANYLLVIANVKLGGYISGAAATAALFKNSDADAISTADVRVQTGSTTYQDAPVVLNHRMLASTTSPITFKIRVGQNLYQGAANLLVNGACPQSMAYTETRTFGGTNISSVTVFEISPTGTGGAGALAISYTNTFTNGDLVSGNLIVNHNLGSKYVIATIYDSNDDVVQPDNVHQTDENSLTADLSSMAPITGTWTIRVISTGSISSSKHGFKSITADTQATENDETFFVNASAGPVTVTLPPAIPELAGLGIIVKKTDATSNNVIIDGYGTQLIDGSLQITFNTQYQSYTVKCNGTGWGVV